ncbi:MAG: RsmB/NOP family class I SAM-dependent RNA methyltransferase [Candidatus Accumulibacter sp.]|jgi:16S rRNA (cytosine967-C5)-methyltransferase|nr:RsmB/NOP family class I SAM-dependent RNA methyltransferase [Accumulibacter sp.]
MRLTPSLIDHAERLLAELLDSPFAADAVVSRYFRRQRELGARERGVLADTAYAALRRRRSLSARCLGAATPRRLALAAMACALGANLRELEPAIGRAEAVWLAEAKALRLDALSPGERLDLPDWLYETLAGRLGAEETGALARALNQPAPLDLRVNTLKAGRDEALSALRESGVEAEACRHSPAGVRVLGKRSLIRHPLFLDGRIEVQDEGSQLLGYLLQPKRGEMVADFCAGAGGKTLHLGALMASRGRLYAFDVSRERLARLKPRLARSGLSNVYPACIASERDARLRRLAGKLDRVLVDAPCSGLGTLRRNPDLKWRHSPESVAELAVKQAAILDAAAELVKPGGRLVYATCSLLAEENDAVADAFFAGHPDFAPVSAGDTLAAQGIEIDIGERLRLSPQKHGTDGFFAVVMERRPAAPGGKAREASQPSGAESSS